jgi:hypothetical protein
MTIPVWAALTTLLCLLSLLIFLPLLLDSYFSKPLLADAKATSMPPWLEKAREKTTIVSGGQHTTTSSALFGLVMICIAFAMLGMLVLLQQLGVTFNVIFQLAISIGLCASGIEGIRRRLPWRKLRKSPFTMGLEIPLIGVVGTAWYWHPSAPSYDVYSIVACWGIMRSVPTVSLKYFVPVALMFVLFDVTSVSTGLMQEAIGASDSSHASLGFMPPGMIIVSLKLFGIKAATGLGFGDLAWAMFILRIATKYQLQWTVFGSYVLAIFLVSGIGAAFDVAMPALVTLVPIMLTTLYLSSRVYRIQLA